MDNSIFENLFVLEMTNNHLGNLQRGIDIIKQHSKIVRFNNIKAAIKLQFRNVDTFIHKDFRNRKDIRYIKRTLETELSKKDYITLVKTIKKCNCIPMATPFDEDSVDFCVELNLPIIKVASADSNDWILLNKIASIKKPVIVSLGGLSVKDTDDLVLFFEHRDIPLALNHCIATYPNQDFELELNQLDFLRNRYPNHPIGLSTHEHGNSALSMYMSYAKGIRLWEKHIDIEDKNISSYSCIPEELNSWFQAFKKAQEICGSPGTCRKTPLLKETEFLDNYIRGIYAKTDIKIGEYLNPNNIYLAIPLQKGQLSCRELNYDEQIITDIKQDSPILIDNIDSPYSTGNLRKIIYERGL